VTKRQHPAGPATAAWLAAGGLAGSALLRSSFNAETGSARFFLLTGGLVGTWSAVALGAGPVPWHGQGKQAGAADAARTLLVVPALTGAATFAGFYAAARVARRHRGLHRAIASVMRYVDAGSTPLVVLVTAGGGVAEEMYFRGALWGGPRPLRKTTLAYAASTAATGNPALVLAGLATSVVFGWQRAATGGVLAPAVTHVTWSLLMLRYLPSLFRAAPAGPRPPAPASPPAPGGQGPAAPPRPSRG
jgi:membrane protease YdiL (CAAX protease family)